MVRPNKSMYESMARIGFNEKPFMEYVQLLLTDVKDQLVTQQNEVQMRILQGRAQVLSELIARINEAPDLSRKA